MTTENNKKSFSRRKFLQRGAIVMGGSIVASYLGCSPMRRFAAQTAESLDAPAAINTFKPDFWFEVLKDNTILMKSPKIEMGQGIFTGFAMIAAEELDVTPSQIKVEHASTKTGSIDSLGTGGSNSTLSLYQPIREVAATMREMLKEAAAKKWGAKASDIATENGTLSFGIYKATYAEIANSTTDWKVPKTPALRTPNTFKYIGTEVKRVDLEAKVMATAEYTIDVTLPGMLYALTLDSPYFEGKIKTIDISTAEKIDGVLKIVQENDLVAVVAKNRFAAEKGLNAIDVTWDFPKNWQQSDIEALVTVGNGKEVNVQKKGNAKTILERSPSQVYRQEYRMPIAAHAQMETYGAVAHVENDKATIIIGSQNPDFVRSQVAKDLGLKKDNIEIKTPYLGGGFGRRTPKNKATQAARLSQIMGKPIKLIPTREQEFYNDMFRPNTHHVLQAFISENGTIEAISHDQATPDEVVKTIAGNMALKFVGADWIAAGHGAGFIYNFPNKTASVWDAKVPYPVSIWRGVGMIPNTFAIESFMNELAYKTKKDPIEMRIELCKGSEEINERYVKILETARKKSDWTSAKPEGVGRGMAMADDRKGIAVCVAEVAIVEGNIVVKKITQLLDCGKAINPNGIRAQMEGCAMMGISAALFEEVLVKDGKMDVSNYHEYALPKLMETPDIQTFIVENSPEPYGVGEPPLAPVAPAIAAAVFNLTGKNLRSLPLKLA